MVTTEQVENLLVRLTGNPEGFGVADPLTIACERAVQAVDLIKVSSATEFLEELNELGRVWDTPVIRGVAIGIGLMLRSEKRSTDA